MFINHLALSYKCHSSIGNSLDLKRMLDEVLYTFVTQTDAISGAFYLKDEDNNLYKYLEFDDKFTEDIHNYIEKANDFGLVQSKIKDENSILIIPVKNGVFYLLYKTGELDFDFIGSMFQDLVVKLNISIDACLNVQRLKTKNIQLDKLAQELKKQKKELEDSSQYQTNFLANVSHELKTPLNSIIVLSSIMGKNKDNSLNEKNLKNIKIINNCGNDLLFLINDILDISKIESGELALNLKKVEVRVMLDDIYSQMLPLAKDRGLELLLVDKTDFEIILFTDEGRIKQILKNLLSNAIKFTDKGQIKIDVSIENAEVSIKVIDQGIGIEKSKINTIFERFKQADGSTTRKYGGTGLGLSVSKELTELLSGSLSAQSVLGEGSTFELRLPLKTNITNISDEKVSLGRSSEEHDEENIESIVLFDEFEADEKESVEEIKEEKKKVLVINKDHLALFTSIIKLQKMDIDVVKIDNVSAIENMKLDFDLVVINDTFLSVDIKEIIKIFEAKAIKILIVSNETYENNNTILHDDVKNDFVNKVSNILGIK